MDHDVFFQDSLMNRKFKRTAFLTRNLTVVVVVCRSLRIWMRSQPGTSSPWLHSHEICSATSTSRSAMEVIGRCVNIFRTHTFPFLFMNEWCIYIALYCVVLYTQSTLQSCGRVSPQPPPVCSIHLDADLSWFHFHFFHLHFLEIKWPLNCTIVHLFFLAVVQKMEEILVRTKKEKPTFIPYFVSACRDLPGKFLLGYQPRGKPR